jgi:hypothetical protein
MTLNPISWFPSLKDFIFRPNTRWDGAFSPSVYFGCNLRQARVEHEVVSAVGSYGTQLNRVLDVLTVLVKDLDRTKLTPLDLQRVVLFEKLAKDADDAARAAQRAKAPLAVELVQRSKRTDADVG